MQVPWGGDEGGGGGVHNRCRIRHRRGDCAIAFHESWLEAVHTNIFMFAINVNGEKLVCAVKYWKWSTVGGLQGAS